MNTVTTECSVAHGIVSGRSVSVVDTPELTYFSSEELLTEIRRSVYLSSPGPHTFLIVFARIENLFSKEVLKYSIILFTHGDLLEGESVEKLIEESCILRDVVQRCGGRFHVFNNRDVNNRDQVNDLLKKIDTIIEQNGGGHYSNQMFEDAQRFRREKEEETERGRGEAERGRGETTAKKR
ncbi:hypothetical protein PO909_000794 [Leuciscus waleckii]